MALICSSARSAARSAVRALSSIDSARIAAICASNAACISRIIPRVSASRSRGFNSKLADLLAHHPPRFGVLLAGLSSKFGEFGAQARSQLTHRGELFARLAAMLGHLAALVRDRSSELGHGQQLGAILVQCVNEATGVARIHADTREPIDELLSVQDHVAILQLGTRFC